MPKHFKGNFTQQDPIPDDGIAAALKVLEHGRLHRYNIVPDEIAEVALFEQEFATYMGMNYALAVASGGSAIACALRAVGVGAGDTVLTNAFTLAPVPGAIASVGGVPIFVEVTNNLVIDLEDLQQKITLHNSRVLLLSHMRGHICDMDTLMKICDDRGVTVIEDCAHTMGARWKDVLSGKHGAIAAYSTQTYKHLNSGEGGILVSDDPELMAKAIMLSGSYMLYDRHTAGPDAKYFKDIQLQTPNISGRMDNLRAAILRPQLANLDEKVTAWNARYKTIQDRLQGTPGLAIIQRDGDEYYVGSSIQFLLSGWNPSKIDRVLNGCAAKGVELKWFGGENPSGFTSRYDSWHYAPKQSLPNSDHILAGLIDMRIPLTFSLEDCALIADIIRHEVNTVFQSEDHK